MWTALLASVVVLAAIVTTICLTMMTHKAKTITPWSIVLDGGRISILIDDKPWQTLGRTDVRGCAIVGKLIVLADETTIYWYGHGTDMRFYELRRIQLGGTFVAMESHEDVLWVLSSIGLCRLENWLIRRWTIQGRELVNPTANSCTVVGDKTTTVTI